MNLKELLDGAISKVASAHKMHDLEQIKAEVMGKNGFVTQAFQTMKSLSDDEKKALGAEINDIKSAFGKVYDDRKEYIESQELNNKLQKEFIDITLPTPNLNTGSIHPISRATKEIMEIFSAMGFTLAEGPDIEDDFHNFTALNIPETHPAREMHDTFYLESKDLLRTHTSTVQIRYLEKNPGECRIMSTGRVYRCDYDMTHTPMFHQFEGLLIGKNINMGHLKFTLKEFLRKFFEVDDIPVRLRPSFFPFTEPSAELDSGCDRSGGSIKIGAGSSWLEVLGCGMVHPNVIKNCGMDPNEYQGFAFGMGVERLAMLKYGISDLRTLFEGDKRWLQHYNTPYYDIPSISGGLS